MKLTNIDIIIKYVSGRTSAKFNHVVQIDDVIIDSRKAKSGCLFVALKGDKQDGHDYVKNIVQNENCFALVNDDFTEDLPNLIYVKDTVLSLGQLAHNYRQEFDIPIVAITGSNGKTTVKEMLKNVLEQKYGTGKVLATEGNLNNHLGAPLTLLNLDKYHQVAVIELGMNHGGELDYLSKIVEPDYAVVNNVLFAHAGHFNGLEDIAKAKGEIYHGLRNNGMAFVDSTSPFAKMWQKNDIAIQNIKTYADEKDECFIKQISTQLAIYQTNLGELEVELKVLGQHNYVNALTVVSMAIELGCSLAEIKAGLENYSGYKGRLEQKIAFNGALIIDDTYNANPDSVKAALLAIQVFNQEKWFVFADLKELGENEKQIHHELAKNIANANIIKLITVGELAKITHDAFCGDKLHFATNEDVVKYCRANLPQDIVVLVKASNSMKLFDIVNKIEQVKE